MPNKLTATNNTIVAIPDNNTTGISNTVNITGGVGFLSAIRVKLNLTHTFIGDLIITLVSPDGTQIKLSNRNGGTTENFTNATFDDTASTLMSAVPGATGTTVSGSVKPVESMLKDFNFPINGTWTLKVSDNSGIDIGTLNNWTLEIDTGDVFVGSANADVYIGVTGGIVTGFTGGTILQAADAIGDTVLAGGGNDVVYTGSGPDYVDAGDGNDIVITGAGADLLVGGAGNDFLSGQDGKDQLLGGADNDNLNGGAGADYIDGGAGIYDFAMYDSSAGGVDVNLTTNVNTGGDAAGDTLVGIEYLLGSSFTDSLTGDANVNALFGGNGFDVLKGLAGTDYLYGEGSIDYLYGGEGADYIDGGAGEGDWSRYDNSTAGVTVNLTTGVNTGGEAQGDTLVSIEGLVGSAFVDSLTGDAGDNFLGGLAGGDTLFGLAGNDSLFGEDGDDALFGGLGGDQLQGGAGVNDIAYYNSSTVGVIVNLTTNVNGGGEAQGDTLSGVEHLFGTAFNDFLTGDANANTLIGDGGDDYLTGLDGADILVGGDGNDVFFGGAGADNMQGGNGASDIAYYSTSASGVSVNLATNVNSGGDAAGDLLSGIENLFGSDFGDSLTGNAGTNVLNGGLGGDRLDGGLGNDFLFSGAGGDDFIFSTAGFGTDTIDYNDTFDVIEISTSMATSFAQLTITSTGGNNYTITSAGFGGGVINVQGDGAIAWNSGDFFFF